MIQIRYYVVTVKKKTLNFALKLGYTLSDADDKTKCTNTFWSIIAKHKTNDKVKTYLLVVKS